MKKLPKHLLEIRLDEKGKLDEVVAGWPAKAAKDTKIMFFHLERMSHDHYWSRIDLPEGKALVIHFWTKRGKTTLFARAERDDYSFERDAKRAAASARADAQRSAIRPAARPRRGKNAPRGGVHR